MKSEAWSEDEDASSTASREGNVCNDALRVVGLHRPGDKSSIFLGTKLSHGPMLCQAMHEAW